MGTGSIVGGRAASSDLVSRSARGETAGGCWTLEVAGMVGQGPGRGRGSLGTRGLEQVGAGSVGQAHSVGLWRELSRQARWGLMQVTGDRERAPLRGCACLPASVWPPRPQTHPRGMGAEGRFLGS